ncbi:predicted protein [Coccidioides posadasii str. Silveira]|uniref:Predicted protein n=1 Tax=Coccidioides posadasii (strain RMSCC 757 / Silveira) TaxID=443226 RepID=E9CSR2_COCPS|nr:predicted protein [Coccidioides posadasii str. Silveira]
MSGVREETNHWRIFNNPEQQTVRQTQLLLSDEQTPAMVISRFKEMIMITQFSSGSHSGKQSTYYLHDR